MSFKILHSSNPSRKESMWALTIGSRSDESIPALERIEEPNNNIGLYKYFLLMFSLLGQQYRFLVFASIS
jgi:hypothetical protein